MESSNNIIIGQPAAPGKVKGKVLIVDKEANLTSLPENSILVMGEVDSNVFALVKHKVLGFIAEGASVTSHVATIAREAGKPCVVQAKEVLEHLKNGMQIELDGDLGLITIL